ncbi:hypothetical protein [Kitasatospora purpeofusca]|uniref:hypothetical protein n=1 Tax=Kitasatospora purpeofusca TaxID=67352 RepID=UPI0038660BE5
MTETHLSRITREHQRQAEEARAEIREAAKEAGCHFPDLEVVPPDPVTGAAGIDLGVVDPTAVLRLAEVIRAGVDALAAEDRPETTVTPLRPPNDGEPVVDTARGRVGAYSGLDGEQWQITSLLGDELWLADPKDVRTATVNERVRTNMAAESSAEVG